MFGSIVKIEYFLVVSLFMDGHYYSDFFSCFIVERNCRGKDNVLLGIFGHLFSFELFFFILFIYLFLLLQVRK